MDAKAQWKQQVNVLLEQVKQGNANAFENLYDMTHSHLFGLVCRIIRDRDLAADVLQEVFIKIWSQAKRHSSEKGCAWNWMSQLTRNQAIDQLRQSQRHRQVECRLAIDAENDSDKEPIDEAKRLVQCIDLEQALVQVSSANRQALILSHVYGFSHQELVSRFDAPLGTLKSRLRRSICTLRSCLEHAF